MTAIIPLSNWSLAGIRGSVNKPHKGLYNAIVVHHSAANVTGGDPISDFQKVERGALSRRNRRGKPIFGAVPYSYLIHAATGTVAEGRGIKHGDGGTRITKTAHTRNGRYVKQGSTISVCVPGNYHPAAGPTDTFTDTEIDNITRGVKLVAAVNHTRLADDWVLLCHRDVGATDCPGDLLATEIGKLAPQVHVPLPSHDIQTDPKAPRTSYEVARQKGWLPDNATPNRPASVYDVAYIVLRAFKDSQNKEG